MKNNKNKVAAVVLAAGKGTRIGQRLPKVIYPIVGKPMLYYCLELTKKIPIEDVFVVVGYKSTDVEASIRSEKVCYVEQKEQLGTGHAAQTAIRAFPKGINEVIVFNGDDSAFFEVGTIRDYLESHHKSNAKISFMSCKVENPFGLGRIIRDKDEKVLGIIEEKMASDEEKKINEVNVGCYVFDKDWFLSSIKKVTKNVTGEYYITDLIAIAIAGGEKVNNYKLSDNDEWRGINNQEELKAANDFMLNRLIKQKEPTVFIFDIDNTLIDTDLIKKYVSKELIHKVIKPRELDIFWREYEESRKKLGYVSIPEFSDSCAEKLNDPKLSEKIRKMFYTIPFNKFVNDGVKELMEYVDPKGEIVILTEGDLVYQPMKIKNLEVSKYLDELFVFENENKNIDEISKIYQNRRKVMIDDKITVLENFKKNVKNSIVIHLKQGNYKDLSSKDSKFKPDFTAKNIEEVTSFIKGLY